MSVNRASSILRYFGKIREQRPELSVYAVLDGARNDRIYSTIVSSDVRHRCLLAGHELLYWGNLPDVLASAAPHIIRLPLGEPVARWLMEEGWGDNWGIYFLSAAKLDELLRHFRRFVMAQDESGRRFYFRFYDPRVFRPYIPTCKPNELEMIFGPIERFVVEGEDDNMLVMHTLENMKLKTRNFRIKSKTGREADGKHGS
jgi:hypothetical protein